ncbi:DUF3102 domain-containing protein [Chlorogloea sp. CCALA 695]|uniref:DUF3102 domain-containing protein n=1 Tax=Chlorogloea sp. CCALA 695 TaxID=2107693 RepID=UPI000D0618D5|nr:DUF3102 domain-containing protein [Chlorogloea sp. CCALA 695]PSB28840.1 hypothetical protein C7B70_20015 [Chlorogloea sp. CCALA 695]
MSSHQRRNNFSEELSTATQAIEFSYGMLSLATRKVVQQHTIEIKGLLRRTAQDIIDIGEKLSEVKQELGHGHFLAWLRTEFDWSESAARKFMQVHRKFKTVQLTNWDIATSALYLLAADSTPEAAREEVLLLADVGEIITLSKAKSIVQQHRQAAQITQPLNTIDIENTSTLNFELESSKVISTPNNSDRYQELSAQLNFLNETQIAALWQALSERLSPNLLKRLVVQAQQKLSSQ